MIIYQIIKKIPIYVKSVISKFGVDSYKRGRNDADKPYAKCPRSLSANSSTPKAWLHL